MVGKKRAKRKTKKVCGKPFTKGNRAGTVKRAAQSPGQIEHDAGEVLHRMAYERNGLVKIWHWCTKERGWTQSHSSTVVARAKELLRAATKEKAHETRARLLAIIENELEHCWRYVTGTAPTVAFEGGGGTIILADPEKDGEFLKVRDHAAIQGYIRLIMKLTGLEAIVVEHRHSERPYRDMQTPELIEELARAEAEIAKRAVPALDVHVHKEEGDA